MEKDKWKHLDRVLKLNCGRTLLDYIKAIARLEKEARKCYLEETIMERKKFLQMLLLDGCFLLVNIDENVGTEVLNSRALELNSIETAINGITAGEAVTNFVESAGGDAQRKHREHAMELELIKVEASQESGRNTEMKDVNHKPNMKNSKGIGDCLSCCAWHDMFLLENQIPFFIVESIYELVVGQGEGVESLRNKTAEFVEDILGHYPIAIQESNRPKHFHHLLHLCHTYFRPSQRTDGALWYQHKRIYFHRALWYQHKKRYFHSLLHLWEFFVTFGHKQVDADKNPEQMDCFQSGKLRICWRRVIEYHDAGIQFKRREYDAQCRHSLLDIRFMDGVIEIPCLPIDETSESLFKNLLALEQIEHMFGNDISAYVTFMLQVIATTADATLLVQSGIIVHMMDSDEDVSALFTRLTKQVTFRFDWKYYLKYICQTLEAHYQSRLNRWIAWLWLNHFRNPWLALAALAAGVMLVCTVVQTLYTVLAYVKPP